MRRFYSPTQDATIYEQYPARQAGLDEILDVGKNEYGTHYFRSLLQFDVAAISTSLSDGTLSKLAEFDLKLFIANSERLVLDQKVEFCLVSQSWIEGQGYYYQDLYTERDGVTWRQRWSGSLWSNSGSDFYASPTASYTLTRPVTDVSVSVTDIVRSWVSGTYANCGLLIKFPTTDEISRNNTGKISFFSRDTHTVHSPYIIAKYDDSARSVGSLSAAPSRELTVYPSNLKSSYRTGETVRVDLVAREQYPLKTYSNIFTAWSNTYLPTSSYYSIVDAQSQKTIVPFDDYSKISVDSNGNYFKFVVENMYPRRYYTVLVKVVTSGYEYVFDNNYTFTVV